jgi:hypothetical protein
MKHDKKYTVWECDKCGKKEDGNSDTVPPIGWYNITIAWSGHLGDAALKMDLCSLNCMRVFVRDLWPEMK